MNLGNYLDMFFRRFLDNLHDNYHYNYRRKLLNNHFYMLHHNHDYKFYHTPHCNFLHSGHDTTHHNHPRKSCCNSSEASGLSTLRACQKLQLWTKKAIYPSLLS